MKKFFDVIIIVELSDTEFDPLSTEPNVLLGKKALESLPIVFLPEKIQMWWLSILRSNFQQK